MTDEARRDLADIGRYSRQTWGAAQAKVYAGLIIEGMSKAIDRPGRGRPHDHLVPGLRRINVRRHAIFYFVRGDDLVVARIVHQSMEIRSGLFRGGDRGGPNED